MWSRLREDVLLSSVKERWIPFRGETVEACGPMPQVEGVEYTTDGIPDLDAWRTIIEQVRRERKGVSQRSIKQRRQTLADTRKRVNESSERLIDAIALCLEWYVDRQEYGVAVKLCEDRQNVQEEMTKWGVDVGGEGEDGGVRI